MESLVSANIKSNQHGYTLVELNLAIVLMGIIIVSVFAVFTNYFVLITRNSVDLNMSVEAQNLLRTITEELRYGAGVRQTNSISDPNSPVSGWNTSNVSFVIITAVPAIDASNNYIIDPFTNKAYLNELVYYKDGKKMYRRTLANSAASGNSIRTSCPPVSATSSCPADVLLASNFQTMTFSLFDQDNILTTNPLVTRSVLINLTMQADSFGTPLTLDTSIRTTLRNSF